MYSHQLPLSPTQALTFSSVSRFGQLTSSQVRRLHYQGTPNGCAVRSRRHLARLVQLGLLKRIGPSHGGYGGGSGESVYLPAASKARTPDLHDLDVAELYVRLLEAVRDMSVPDILAYDPEPWSWRTVGHMELKPDAYTRIKTDAGITQYFIELDRGSEFKSQLSTKMRRYVAAYEKWDEPTFPLVVWVVPDGDRARFMQSVIRRQAEPGLFTVVTFDKAVEMLTN